MSRKICQEYPKRGDLYFSQNNLLFTITQSLKKNVAEKNEAQQEMMKLKKEKEILVSQLERDLQHQKAKLERVKNRLQNQKARLKSMKQLASLEASIFSRFSIKNLKRWKTKP